MLKNKIKNKNRFHWTHFAAIGLLAGYFLLSKVNLVKALSYADTTKGFIQLYLFGIFFACIFLFIFSNEKFFPFAKEIEKKEMKEEKRYLDKYLHHGKIFGTLIIGSLGGPVFSSLTARFLLNNFWYKYLIVILANIPSTIFTIGAGNGIIKFLNF